MTNNPRMRFVVTLLALFAFSLHLLLGCCAHHAHGEEGLPGHRHGGHALNHVHLPDWLCFHSSDFHSHGSHDHAPGEHEHEHDSQPTPHVPCADPDCVFVAATNAGAHELNDLTLASSLPVTVDDWLAAVVVPATDHDGSGEFDRAPHLRRHLALSRFLN